jgi:uncharacterized lipoprotein YmbA
MKLSLVTWWLTALTSVGLVGGCSALSPQPDRTKYFTLSPVAASERAPALVGPVERTLGIGPVTIPDQLEDGIVTRMSSEEVAISDNDRWGQPLRDSLVTVLRQNLVRLLGTQHVVIFPWQPSSAPDLAVSLELLHFERTTAGTVELSARWSVERGAGGPPLLINETSITRPYEGTDTRAAVAALSLALADLSRLIALDLTAAWRPGAAPSVGRR